MLTQRTLRATWLYSSKQRLWCLSCVKRRYVTAQVSKADQFSIFPDTAKTPRAKETSFIYHAPTEPKNNVENTELLNHTLHIAPAATTALMQEVANIQDLHKQHILLVQVGNFYEIYDHHGYLDEIARLLYLKVGTNNRVSFAGFPCFKLKAYVDQLLENGKTVAVVDQVADDLRNKTKTKLRAVKRIYTPGTVVDDEFVESKENRFLLSISADSSCSGTLGISWADLSTGVSFICETSPGELMDHIARIQPTEIVYENTFQELYPHAYEAIGTSADVYLFTMLDRRQLRNKDQSVTKPHFEKQNASDETPSSILQLAHRNLLSYVAGNLCGTVALRPPVLFSPSSVMGIDLVTQSALELTRTSRDRSRKGSLLDHIDRTKTAGGGRLLADRLKAPSMRLSEIVERLNTVQLFMDDTGLLFEVRKLLGDCKDAEKSLQRLKLQTSGPVDYIHILTSLKVALQLQKVILSATSAHPEVQIVMQNLARDLQNAEHLLSICGDIFVEGFQPTSGMELATIRANVLPELDVQRVAHKDLLQMRDKMQHELHTSTVDHVSLVADSKVGPCIRVLNVRGAEKVRITKKISKLADMAIVEMRPLSGIGFHFKMWTELAEKISDGECEIMRLQLHALNATFSMMQAHFPQFQQICMLLAAIDVASASAQVAIEKSYCKPELNYSHENRMLRKITGGRHPVVETTQRRRDTMYVRNDFRIGSNERCWVLTGPNMGGKSTFLRQRLVYALISVMAQAGLYVPADSAVLGIVDKVFARIGASDNLGGHQSTFMIEMQETATIMKNATERSFVILDEIGRGTSTRDGLAIAFAILNYFYKVKCRTVFATHHHDLARRVEDMKLQDANAFASMKCYQTANGVLIYTYRLEPGILMHSHGIECARLAG
ncbi:muts domain V-domain-containing protein [Phlyctochytrium arcticum]|nr:muts domain V-domain-containing protein [Phlyctochytrium arcticum]